MKKDVRTVSQGSPLEFSYMLDLSELEFGGQVIYRKPVEIQVKVAKTAGIVSLFGHWKAEMSFRCDRCDQEFTRSESGDLDVTLVEEAPQAERDDYFLCQGGICDLDELFRPIFVLLPPNKVLCSPECAGLCPGCGVNLNDGNCQCQKDIDPRWDALKAFMPE